MWKIAVAFIVFAGAALFFIFKAGDKVDMQGEATGHDMTEVYSASATASAPAAPMPADTAASSASASAATPTTPASASSESASAK
ncbi:hypothetical protein ACO0K3_02095 [Undibacterium sp. Rencai35W]|uniref:hypothetical protein n=1 Tax=Undibacterium sp. Rencai35W TaxID=3413046 RepID=UPI003BF0EC5E